MNSIKSSIGSLATRILKKNEENESGKSSFKDSKDKPILTAHFKNLVDLVESEGKPAFLIKEDGVPRVLFKIELDGKPCFPPPKDQIPWLLPRADNVIEYFNISKAQEPAIVDHNLFEDLVTYHKGISELPSESYYVLLSAWVMHTYLMESFHYSPILLFFAVPERGKSRTGKGLIYVAYRGVHTETLNEANLFRWSENHKASLFLDVRNLWQKAERRGSDDILLSRIERGCKVSRVLWPERGAFRDSKHYDVFGPTVIATNEAVHPILDTRCISITMSDSVKNFEKSVKPEVALPLKERLVEFRLRHLGELQPKVPKPARGRLGDILKPIYQTIQMVCPSRKDEFINLVEQIEEGKKLEKSLSLEARLIQVIEELQYRVTNGFVSVTEITEKLNLGKPEMEWLTPHRISRKLKAIGFDWGLNANGTAAIAYNQIKLDRLKEHYGLNQTPVKPVTPVIREIKPEPMNDHAGFTGDTGFSSNEGKELEDQEEIEDSVDL
ncbi:MAG: hypothetical protein HYT97_05030 [Elusimicrobia bacterium]|nr:hypothetical protein [Elusimicrobiota bacterium]